MNASDLKANAAGPARLLVIMTIASLIMTTPSCGSDGKSGSMTAASETGGVFLLASPVAVDGGTLPAEYTCDGAGSTIALSWSNAPAGTKEFALMMTTLPGDGTTKWNWVLYGIPASATGLHKNSAGIGVTGVGGDGPQAAYQPPCSQGPGAKVYTYTLYALSSSPKLPAVASQVTGALLTEAIASITIGRASLSLSYTRPL